MRRSATLSAEASAEESADESAEEFVVEDRGAENWVEVGEALRARREELGLTQEQLYKKSGVSIAIIREIEQHEIIRRRSARTLSALSRALDWPESHLADIRDGRQIPKAAEPSQEEAALQSVLDKLDEILTDRLNEIVVPHLNQIERQLRALPDVIYHLGGDVTPVIDLDNKDEGG
jgi:transcriptional regulator with XRE-family HTH domain